MAPRPPLDQIGRQTAHLEFSKENAYKLKTNAPHSGCVTVRYRPDIDGLRAVAVVPVILFHAGFETFGGGYIGVDVFFVISGYLITQLIVEEIEEGRFTLLSFYERRARRILPALFTVILVSAFAASLLLLPDSFNDFAKSVAASALFSSNVLFWSETSYFGAAAQAKPLLHTWSLAVEEQFYILYPILIMVLARFCRAPWSAFLLPIAAVSFALGLWGVANSPPGAFYLAPPRAWEFLLGSLLVLGGIPAMRSRALGEAAAAAGLGLILWSVFAFNAATPVPGANAAVPCLGTALLLYAGASGTPLINRFFSLRPLVFAGLISYSLYLWHWPALVFARYYLFRSLTSLEAAGLIGASVLAAVLSWRFVEMPFRGRASRVGRRAVFVGASATMAALVVLGGVGVVTDGWAQRFPGYAQIKIPGQAYFRIGTCLASPEQTYRDWARNACFLETSGPSNMLLWGDSHAAQYVHGLNANGHAIGHRILQFTMGLCPPVLGFDPAKASPNCLDFNRHVFDVIKRFDIATVVMAANWKVATLGGLDLGDLAHTIEALKRKGLQVVVIGQSPYFEFPVKDLIYRTHHGDTAPLALDRDLNRRISANAPGAVFIDPLPLLCDEDACRFRDGDSFLFLDYAHLSAAGSDRLVSSYLPVLNRDTSGPSLMPAGRNVLH